MNQDLHPLLTQLHLKGMAHALDHELQRAEKEAAPVSEVIHRLLIQEQLYRQERSHTYRLKQLAGLSFLERKENIIFIGNPGTGKSGLAIGLLPDTKELSRTDSLCPP